MNKIPITLITGFLGSGKTTLVNHLLTHSTEKIAVVVNEFGSVGIDDQLILRSDNDVMELTTGSICCAAKNDTLHVLETLIDRQDTASFVRVILETTGLANPAPLLRSFAEKPLLAKRYHIESVVVVVDALHAPEQLLSRPEMARQLAFADIVLVNKSEAVEGNMIIFLEAEIRRINPLARIYRTSYGNIPLESILDASLFEEDRPLTALATDAAEHHGHDEEITSIILRAKRPLVLEKVATWIGEELLLEGENLLRYKGILWIYGMDERFVFQGVHHAFENRKDRRWEQTDERRSEVVLIGKNLAKDRLESSFLACQREL